MNIIDIRDQDAGHLENRCLDKMMAGPCGNRTHPTQALLTSRLILKTRQTTRPDPAPLSKVILTGCNSKVKLLFSHLDNVRVYSVH